VVSDSKGVVDIDLSAGDWVTDSRFQGDFAFNLDGTDNRWETQSTLGVNNQQFSVAFWVWDYGGATNQATPFAWSAGGTIPDNGWVIEDSSDSLGVRFINGGASNFIVQNLNLVTDGSKSYFIGLAGDGDSGDVYVWDTTQQVHNASGTGTRGDKGIDKLLSGGGRTDSPRWLNGAQDAQYASTTTAWTESEFVSIWNATKP